ncbi:MAG: uroporphyrinogen decarboxylase family protein, partial [Planctomycetota bacterium]|nr:uroporphyrinogen decarboxylase family protein [Planctomycetota bacterium]
MTSPEVWKEYREPLLELSTDRIGNVEDARKALADARDRGKFAVMGNLFVWELMRCTIGEENFLPALLTDPDWIHDFCQVHLDFYRKHYELLFREAGLPDGFFIYEDFGFSNGLYCSPKTLGELVMPYEKAFVSFLKDYGLPVLMHSCGDIRKAVPLMIDAGFDCLQPMEAKAGNDVLEFARIYGNQISYMGNIDIVPLSTNDPAAIRAEIEPKVKELNRLRIPYFFHSDHSIPPNVSFETYKLALQIFQENRRYE